MEKVSTNETAKILGVSSATVRNWCRAGHLEALSGHPLTFDKQSVLALKERIRTNRFSRLRKRANKSAADALSLPRDVDAKNAPGLDGLCAACAAEHHDVAHFLYTAALRHLWKKGEVHLPNPNQPDNGIERAAWKRKAVQDVMYGWAGRLPETRKQAPFELFAPLDAWNSEDPLGVLYQSLSSAGRKARAGAFFTPESVIDDSLADLGATPRTFLDPCCGTGRYLVGAAKAFAMDPGRILGFDSDPLCADIARLNLLLAYKDRDFTPNIHCLDSLRDLANGNPDCDTNHLAGALDAIATNPPWGGCKNLGQNKNLAQWIKSGESFSLFVEKSLQLVRKGGVLSFILPDAMLKIKTHADLRKLLLAETRIRKITYLGRVFPAVVTPVMRLDLEKREPPADWRISIVRNGATHHAPQSRFVANLSHTFDVAVKPRDDEVLEKIYRVKHQTLRDNADWALGIVTGDNGSCVHAASVPGAEPVLRGRDVLKFATRKPDRYIVFQPDRFQQVAPERLYRAPEKLIYRFVSDRLVFAYDNQGLLTLNSANILIPRLPHLTMKAALAFLNSQVFQYIFLKRFRTRKVLRGDLETLPFPYVSAVYLRAVEEQVDRCMEGEYQPADDLDRMVYNCFGLDEHDIATIQEGVREEAAMPLV